MPLNLRVPAGIFDRRVLFAKRFKALTQLQKASFDPSLFMLPQADTLSAPAVDRQQPDQQNKPAPVSCTLIVPGLLGDSVSSLVAPFFSARQTLDINGYCTQIAWVNGRRGCDHNAALLRRTVLAAAEEGGTPINIIAYSKGCPDVLHMLAQYPETHAAVAALVSYGGVVHGSPLADQTHWLMAKFLQYAPLPGRGFGDGLAVADLRTDFRTQWLRDNPLPPSIRYASIAAAPPRHRVSRILKSSYDKLARMNADNDSQVIWKDVLIPGSELLAVVQADHWALALPVDTRLPIVARTLVNKNTFPRRLMLRSIIDYLANVPRENLPRQTTDSPPVEY